MIHFRIFLTFFFITFVMGSLAHAWRKKESKGVVNGKKWKPSSDYFDSKDSYSLVGLKRWGIMMENNGLWMVFEWWGYVFNYGWGCGAALHPYFATFASQYLLVPHLLRDAFNAPKCRQIRGLLVGFEWTLFCMTGNYKKIW